MKRTILLAAGLFVACTTNGCVRPNETQTTSTASGQESWLEWHAKKQQVDLAVSKAINEPGNGDYAKAVAIIRASDRPEGVKLYDIGHLVIGGVEQRTTRPPKETLQQGLEMIENAALMPGESGEVAPQSLRMIFERGAGAAPNHIPIDPVVAQCWHSIETHKAQDAQKCITLRRQRLPRVGQ